MTGDRTLRVLPHAMQRMREMDVDLFEVIATLQDPRVTYPGRPSAGRDTRVHVGGRLAVVTLREDDTVITVLWDGEFER